MADYTDWPVKADGELLLKSAGLETRLDPQRFADRFERARADVIGQILRKTHRQFVAGADDEERFYDGTGAAEQEVDEMVSLSSVVVIGLQSDPGYTLDNVLLVEDQAIARTRIIVAQGSLPAYATNAAFLPYRTIFPVGRQNIKVIGKFGFAAEIPADLWEAACGEMMSSISNELLFQQDGRVLKKTTGDVSYTYALETMRDWHDGFLTALRDYKRPSGRRLRMMAPRMI